MSFLGWRKIGVESDRDPFVTFVAVCFDTDDACCCWDISRSYNTQDWMRLFGWRQRNTTVVGT